MENIGSETPRTDAAISEASHFVNWDSVIDEKMGDLERDLARLMAENELLKKENFALAAGVCQQVVGDEGGTPVCKRAIAAEQALRGYVMAMQSGNPDLLEHADKQARAALKGEQK